VQPRRPHSPQPQAVKHCLHGLQCATMRAQGNVSCTWCDSLSHISWTWSFRQAMPTAQAAHLATRRLRPLPTRSRAPGARCCAGCTANCTRRRRRAWAAPTLRARPAGASGAAAPGGWPCSPARRRAATRASHPPRPRPPQAVAARTHAAARPVGRAWAMAATLWLAARTSAALAAWRRAVARPESPRRCGMCSQAQLRPPGQLRARAAAPGRAGRLTQGPRRPVLAPACASTAQAARRAPQEGRAPVPPPSLQQAWSQAAASARPPARTGSRPRPRRPPGPAQAPSLCGRAPRCRAPRTWRPARRRRRRARSAASLAAVRRGSPADVCRCVGRVESRQPRLCFEFVM